MSSWDQAFLHYTTNDWTWWNDIPGRPLAASTVAGYPAPKWRMVTVLGNNVTFVFTNGQGKWDNNNGANYRVRHMWVSGWGDGTAVTDVTGSVL